MEQRRFPAKPILGFPVALVFPQGLSERPTKWEADVRGEVLSADSRIALEALIQSRTETPKPGSPAQLDLIGE